MSKSLNGPGAQSKTHFTHPKTDKQKHKVAERLSAELAGVRVTYEPTVSFRHDPDGQGNHYWVSLDTEVFECGSAYIDARSVPDGNLLVALAASLRLQARRLGQAAAELIARYGLDAEAVQAAIEFEQTAEEAEAAARKGGGR